MVAAGEDRGGHGGAERAADGPHDRVDAGRDADLGLRHGGDDQVRHRGEANEMPAPSRTPASDELPRGAVREREHHERRDASAAPAASVTRKPIRAPSRPASGPATSCASAAGSSSRPACGDRDAEPVARALRRLRELRDQQEAREHREADHEARQVRGRDRAQAQHAQVDQRLGRRAPRRAARRRSATSPPTSSASVAASPSPSRWPRSRRAGARASAGREQRRAEPVDPRARDAAATAARAGAAASAAGRAISADPEQPRRRRGCRRSRRDSGSPMPPPMPNIALEQPDRARRRARAGTCRG